MACAVAGRRRQWSLIMVAAGSHPPSVAPTAASASAARYPASLPHSPAVSSPIPTMGSPVSIARRAPQRRAISQPAAGISSVGSSSRCHPGKR